MAMDEQIFIRLQRIENLLAEIQAGQSPKEYLSTDEVCQLLSVTRPTLWSWHKKKILTHSTIGNLIRYRRADIDKLMNNRRTNKH
jgi:excisionase family DNA binding protein